jgi:hypothetical protein
MTVCILRTLEIERVLLATFQIVHAKSADDLLPLDHIAGVDRSLWCTRCRADRWCFRVLGTRNAGTLRESSRRTNQADGCLNEVAAIEALFVFVWHGEASLRYVRLGSLVMSPVRGMPLAAGQILLISIDQFTVSDASKGKPDTNHFHQTEHTFEFG